MLLAAEEQNTKDTSAGVGKALLLKNVHSAEKSRGQKRRWIAAATQRRKVSSAADGRGSHD